MGEELYGGHTLAGVRHLIETQARAGDHSRWPLEIMRDLVTRIEQLEEALIAARKLQD